MNVCKFLTNGENQPLNGHDTAAGSPSCTLLGAAIVVALQKHTKKTSCCGIKTMDTVLKKGLSHLVGMIFVLSVSLIMGGILSLVIGLRYDQFIWIPAFITISDSLFLGVGILISVYFIRYLAPETNSIISLLLLVIGLILGMQIIAFVVFFFARPTAFLYSDNRTVTYLMINLLFFISINTIISGFVIFQRTVLEKEKALHEERALKAQMELKMLSSKVNPHFLFNSLNMMVSLLKTPQKAESALINLAEILRYQLDFSDARSVSITSELRVVEKYLALQQMRFGDKLDYRIECDVEGQIPPMVIQPLVENCIKHNIDKTDQLVVQLRVIQTPEGVVINVLDSMARLEPNMLTRGVGLTVTEKRVEHLGGTFSIKNGGVEISFNL